MRMSVRRSRAVTASELRAVRGRLGLTQTALGQRLGVALRTVQSWEYGERSIPAPVERLLPLLEKERPPAR